MNQLSMLREIVSSIETGPRSIFTDGANYIARSSDVRTGVASGINRKAEAELRHFVKLLYKTTRIFTFSTTYEEFFSSVCSKIIKDFQGRDSSSIIQVDLEKFESEIREHITGQQAIRDVFVPCIITTYPASNFKIGPVEFTFIDNFVPPNATPNFNPFSRVLESMRAESVFWIATASIPETTSNRGLELSDLTVDLALTPRVTQSAPLMVSSKCST